VRVAQHDIVDWGGRKKKKRQTHLS
jgi:hypothetical protein